MPSYIAMKSNGRSAIIRNQLWFRKYFLGKQSKIKHRWKYYSHGSWEPFSDVGIHSHY